MVIYRCILPRLQNAAFRMLRSAEWHVAAATFKAPFILSSAILSTCLLILECLISLPKKLCFRRYSLLLLGEIDPSSYSIANRSSSLNSSSRTLSLMLIIVLLHIELIIESFALRILCSIASITSIKPGSLKVSVRHRALGRSG